MQMKKIYLLLLLLFGFSLFTVPLFAQTINVRGTVKNLDGEPLVRATIYDAKTNKLLGFTDSEGNYMESISPTGELLFANIGYSDKTVPVNGELKVDVLMAHVATALEEVVVSAKRIVDRVMPEPTDIEVIGNYFHIRTRVKVPHELFSMNARMIIQPGIYNVTKKEMTLLNPVVFDGKEYAITQERMYDFDLSKDPLSKFVRVKKAGYKKDDWIHYVDSSYIENPKDDFRCDVMVAMENYNRILYRDTFAIARGVINPLRFLEYSFAGSMVSDTAYFPKPEMQLCESQGSVNLAFAVGKRDLNMNDKRNQEELERLRRELKEVEDNPNAMLRTFSIVGSSSPDGTYKKNVELAQGRMASALKTISGVLKPETRKTIKTSSVSSVETWEHVVDLLQADSLKKEADQIAQIIKKYPNSPDQQFRAISRLPFYRKMIVPNYLPKLRKVNYAYTFMQYRLLTDEEIENLYNTNYKALSKNEFWKYYTKLTDPAEKEIACRRALEVHPKFVVAASDLAGLLIMRDSVDADILEPFINGQPIPDEAKLNQTIAYMKKGLYTRADSLASELPDSDVFRRIKAFSAALNGNYESALMEVSSSSLMNEVVMLLAIKSNEQAWKRSRQLGHTAKEEYVKAIASNRMERIIEAMDHIESALELDPSLREIAEVDGDVLDLLE